MSQNTMAQLSKTANEQNVYYCFPERNGMILEPFFWTCTVVDICTTYPITRNVGVFDCGGRDTLGEAWNETSCEDIDVLVCIL